MSETTTPAPEPTAPSVDPPAPEPTPEPAPEPVEQTEEEKKAARDAEGRRVAVVRARLGAAERERDRLAMENAALRAQQQGLQPAEETPEQREARRDAEALQRAEGRVEARRFHEEGANAYPDWKGRCDDLVAMGADAGFASLLVSMPGGVRVAAALAQDPEAVQRIANIATERGRAVALGTYAARLDGTTTTQRTPPVTRAPAPVRPVTGRASPTFNEYTANVDQLVDHYLKPPTRH
jgi:hypothetical protein